MLITKQQPIASDLRMMISSLKIASDLERIGDNAASIANIRLRTKITDDYVLTRLKQWEISHVNVKRFRPSI